MSVTIVQEVASSAGTGTQTATFSNPVTTGNAVIVVVGCNYGTRLLIATPTDSESNTYHNFPVGGADTGTGISSPNVQMFIAYDITGGSSFEITEVFQTFCCSCNPVGGSGAFVAYEVSGLITTNPSDKSAANTGSGTSPSSTATPAITQAVELVVGGLALFQATTGGISAGSGYTNLKTAGAAASMNVGMESLVTSTIAAQTATFSVGGDVDGYACVVGTFKAVTPPATNQFFPLLTA